jgi:hypothetical protein
MAGEEDTMGKRKRLGILGAVIAVVALVVGAVSPALGSSSTFTGTVSPKGLLPRNPDGSCAVGQPLLYEVDMVAFSGTLSF